MTTTIAQDTYAAVNEMIAADGVTKQEAFKRLGEQTGKNPGTVAANYYRQQNKEASESRSSRPARARRPRRSSPDTELSDALARLEESLQAVVRIAVERDKQLEALRALLR